MAESAFAQDIDRHLRETAEHIAASQRRLAIAVEKLAALSAELERDAETLRKSRLLLVALDDRLRQSTGGTVKVPCL